MHAKRDTVRRPVNMLAHTYLNRNTNYFRLISIMFFLYFVGTHNVRIKQCYCLVLHGKKTVTLIYYLFTQRQQYKIKHNKNSIIYARNVNRSIALLNSVMVSSLIRQEIRKSITGMWNDIVLFF